MDIAIIGMSGRFPGAENLEIFAKRLEKGEDLVLPLSFERISRTALPVEDYQVMGYIDNIDLFDINFFGLSATEVIAMDPHQRLLLEVVYETFQSAGYNVDKFEGSETGVFIGDVDLTYYKHATQFEPDLITGNLNAATAGRIARFFNLRGGAQMIDSSCSSSLTALYHACNELQLGHINSAVVAAANLVLFPQTLKETIFGIESPDGKCRAFSEAASGTGTGEAVCAILIKPLAEAIKDGDNIHAVIKGIAINQDGALSANLASPDPVAQSEVILKAIKRAGIDPLSVTSIEAHGTGTKLGDPIEVEGISLAFSPFTSQKQFCAISSVKSNIGHANSAAGLASVIKTVLSLKHKVLYPTLHCNETNPLIDFENSPVYVNKQLKQWLSPGVAQKRRAGVSSFGFMGTNSHLIIEEAPSLLMDVEADGFYAGSLLPIFVSGKSEKALKDNLIALRDFLVKHPHGSLEDIAFTLSVGRKHHSYRFACAASGGSDLIQKIELFLNEAKATERTCDNLIIVFSGQHAITREEIESLSKISPVFSERWQECSSLLSGTQLQNPHVVTLVFYYSFYGLLIENAIFPGRMLSNGVGKIAADLIQGKVSILQAVQSVEQGGYSNEADLEYRLKSALAKFGNLHATIFLECGQSGILSDALRTVDGKLLVTSFSTNTFTGLSNLFVSLYMGGLKFEWEKTFLRRVGRRIELPTYKFDRQRHWLSNQTFVDRSNLFYQIEWKNVEARSVDTEITNDDTWVVVTDDLNSMQKLKGHLNIDNAIWVTLGKYFQILNRNELIIDIEKEDCFKKVVKLAADRGVRMHHMVYVVGLEDDPERSFRNYFSIVKAFVVAGATNNFSLVTFTNDCLNVSGKAAHNPWQAAIHGFNIGMIAEYPDAHIRCIDLDGESFNDLQKIFLHERQNTNNLVSVAYREKKQYHRVLAQAETRQIKPLTLKNGELFLVTGGSSGIGLEITKWLAFQAVVKIAVIGRKELPPKKQWQLLESTHEHYNIIREFLDCEKAGSTIFYWSVDLGHEEQVKNVVEDIKKQCGAISGVIHSAGVAGSSRLERQSWQTFREPLIAKINGTHNLVSSISPESLSFFILFSSLNSLVGVERGINYSAANYFLDNYASTLRHRGYPASVVNWTSWKRTGMWARMHQTDIDDESLDIYEGLSVLKDLLSGRYKDVIVSKTNPLTIESKSYIIKANDKFNNADTASFELKQKDVKLTYKGGQVEELLKTIWISTLRVDSVAPTDDFFKTGGHSLTALKLIMQIEKSFSIKLEIADILAAATFEKICELVRSIVREGNNNLTGKQVASHLNTN